MQGPLLNNKYRIIDTKTARGGVYGMVNKATNMQNNDIVAIKELRERVGGEGLNSTVWRQRSILNVLGDTNIVQLIQSFIDQDRIFLVFPYIETSLRDFMVYEFNNNVPTQYVRRIIKQILSALKTTHCARFIHRDIKPENVLVQKSQDNPLNFVIKLADWGSSRKMNLCQNQNFTQQVITLAYRPPELLFGTKQYKQTVDIWSLGCLFAELIFGERIFQNKSQNLILLQIVQTIGLSENDDYSWIVEKYKLNNFQQTVQQLKNCRAIVLDQKFKAIFGKVTPACDLIKKMLRVNPQKRISAADALKHEYFDN